MKSGVKGKKTSTQRGEKHRVKGNKAIRLLESEEHGTLVDAPTAGLSQRGYRSVGVGSKDF